MTSTPLPELDEILDQLYQRGYQSGLERTGLTLEQRVAEAKQAIRTLILEEIIGEDEYYGPKLFKPARNELRAEQRQRLAKLLKESK